MLEKFVEKWNRDDDDRFHFRVSVVKSVFRIAAGFLLIGGSLIGAGLCLIIAEGLGIAEEM